MIVFLNGKFVAGEKALVSIFDRGFLYGDGLFEGILISHGLPFHWDDHLTRLQHGLDFLKIRAPIDSKKLHAAALELVRRNKMPEAIMRLSVSRGVTERGYSPKNAINPVVALALHPLPKNDWTKLPRWAVVIASPRLTAGDPLAAFKTANKLVQVMARSQADDAGAQEALVLNTKGFLAEGTTSNLFWIDGQTVCTPPLITGALPGVTRSIILNLCRRRKFPVKQVNARPAALLKSHGAFLTMTSFGVAEIATVNGAKLPRSPITAALWRDYRATLNSSAFPS